MPSIISSISIKPVMPVVQKAAPIFFFIIFSFFPPSVFGVSTRGLVGYWTFDRSAQDVSGYSHNGTFHRTPLFVPGRTRLCADFGDSENHVLVSNEDDRLTLLRAGTVEAWIKGHNLDRGLYHIYIKENSFTLSVFDGNVAVQGTRGWWKPGKTPLPSDRWVHVAWTWDGSYQRIYIDGKETAGSPASGTLSRGREIYISHPRHPFPGLIDEVKVYNRALTAVEIESSFYEGLALAGYWPLDGGTEDNSTFGNYQGAFVGLGLRFSGHNDHISINTGASVPAFTGEVTVAAWIRGDTFDQSYHIIYENSRSYSLVVINRKLAMACAGKTWEPETPVLEAGRWYCVTGTCGPQWKKLYIDGKEVARVPQTLSVSPGTAVTIGRGFHGFIDEVKVYSKSLPPHVIEQNFIDIPRPLGIWSFDNNTRDKSGFHHHGKPVNGPRYTRGKINQCLHFDGNNDYVLIDNDDHRLNILGNLSIEAWINPYALKNDYQHIYDKYRSYTLSVKNGILAVGGRSGWWYPALPVLNPGEWYHVVCTYDYDGKKLYVNGLLVSSKSDDVLPWFGDAVYISHPYFPFNGLIDEIKVYNSTLSARDVFIRYNAVGR